MSKRVPNSLKLATLLAAAAAAAFADSINFESQCASGPKANGPCSTLFSTVGNEQDLSIATASGTVTITGGAVFDTTANLPADQTAVYGTAGNSSLIGVFPGAGFTNPLVITFPKPILNFSLDIFNGNTMTVQYELADNRGDTADFQIVPNFSMGLQSNGFATTGNQVTISAITGQNTPSGLTWDFLIDNINFTPVPEPSTYWLLGVGLAALALGRRPGVLLALLVGGVLMTPSASAATGPPVVTVTCPSASGTAGIAYSSSLSASGGIAPYTYSITSGGLPGGLTLAPTGAITGKPLSGGTATFTAKAVDSLVPGAGGQADSGSATCSIAVAGPPAITNLTPYIVVAGGAMFTLTIDGSGFNSTSVATWNGTPLPTTFVNPTRVTVPVTAGLITTPQFATITVNNGSLASNPGDVSVLETWVQITDQYAVTFGQTAPLDSDLIFDWQAGMAFADYKQLSKDGITGGYIQVLEFDSTDPQNDGAWVVQNLPIEGPQFLAGNGVPFTFAAQVGGAMPGTQAAVYHTKFPAAPPRPPVRPVVPPPPPVRPFVPPVMPAPPKPQFFPLRPIPSTIGGMLPPPLPNPPDPSTIMPIDPDMKRTDSQDSLTDEDSVEQQKNECAPSSVANSMEYLGVKDGAKNVPAGQAKSRVGLLDAQMGYNMNLGTSALGILNGKARYIAGANPTGKPLALTMDSQGRFCPTGSIDPKCPGGKDGDSGATVKDNFITDALAAKKDVEVCFAWPAYPATVGPPPRAAPPGGAHCVFVTGYHFVNGFLELDATQDLNQGKKGGVGAGDGGHVVLRVGIVNGQLWMPSFFGRPAQITNVVTEAAK
jgi:hypothetical protein